MSSPIREILVDFYNEVAQDITYEGNLINNGDGNIVFTKARTKAEQRLRELVEEVIGEDDPVHELVESDDPRLRRGNLWMVRNDLRAEQRLRLNELFNTEEEK